MNKYFEWVHVNDGLPTEHGKYVVKLHGMECAEIWLDDPRWRLVYSWAKPVDETELEKQNKDLLKSLETLNKTLKSNQ